MKKTEIHDLSAVHNKAQLGAGVVVEAFASVAEDVEIGDGTWVGSGAVIMNGARIGKNCKIFPGAVISAEPQDLKYKGEKTTFIIGNNTTIRECCTLNKGTMDRGYSAVGDNCLLMAYVHVAHDAIIGNNCIIANSANIAGHVTIEDHVILEGVVAIQQFVSIGKYCFIGGGSLVRKNVPPYIKAAREPLSYVGVNTIGLRRRGFDNESVQRIEDVYRYLYIHNSNFSQALLAAESELPRSEEKSYILDFINNSTKGVIRGPF